MASGSLGAASRTDDGRLTLYRDQWGVPHIYAESEAAGFFGLGYAQAEDDLQGLLAAYLATQGRSARVFGRGNIPWGLNALQTDSMARTWGLEAIARSAVAALDHQVRQDFEAYAAGVAHYMAQHSDRVPAWGRPPQLWQIVALPQLLLWSFQSGDGLRDCAAAGVSLTNTADLGSSSAHGSASNAWALAPWRTAEGAAMVLSDPHGGIDGRLFHEVRMRTGSLDFSGYAIGALLLLGQNANVAWGLTTGGPDVADCYELSLDPSDPQRYRIHGAWRRFTSERVLIEVKGEASVQRDVDRAEINGFTAPVVARAGTRAYAVVTPYVAGAERLANEVNLMIRARSIEDLRAANRLLGMFPQNLVAADRAGGIYYLRAGRAPRRSLQPDWRAPVSGNDENTRWQGLHPAADLVTVVNPGTGYLQNNNAPLTMMAAGPPLVDPDAYPAYIRNDVPELQSTDRAARTNEVLGGASYFTTEDAKRFALDEKWYGTERWRELLNAAVALRGSKVASASGDFRRVLHRLLTFDGLARADSVAALNHLYWRTAFLASLAESQYEEVVQWTPGNPTLSEPLADATLGAVELGIAKMREELGSVDLAYGAVHRIGRVGGRDWPLGGGPSVDVEYYSACRKQPSALSGLCTSTMRAFHFSPAVDGPGRRVVGGSRALRLTILGERPLVFTLHNFGQSSDAASAHFDDQARLLSSPGQLKEVVLEEASLRKVAASVLKLRMPR